MPQYLYQLSYTSESIAAMVKEPQDRLETAARPVLEAIGGKLLGGGFAFGEYDVVLVAEVPDQSAAVALAMAVQASGAFTKLVLLEQLEIGPILATAQKAMQVYKPAG